jgi:hypothetical protein
MACNSDFKAFSDAAERTPVNSISTVTGWVSGVGFPGRELAAISKQRKNATRRICSQPLDKEFFTGSG